MKGFYILAAIVIIVASLIYMAFRESNADLERHQERLSESVVSVKKILEDSLEPLARLRKEKTTDRLNKRHHQLRSRVDKAERVLNAALHSIETVNNATRPDTERHLKRIGDEVTSLVNEVGIFHSRVKLIDWFVTRHKSTRTRITELMAGIERRVKELSVSGHPVDSATEERINKVAGNTVLALRQAEKTLQWIWQDLEQGRIYAEGRIEDLKGCVPVLEVLLNDLSRNS